MSDLRQAVIKMAREIPETRRHLVPLLQKTASVLSLRGLKDYFLNSIEHTSNAREAVQELVGFGYPPKFSNDLVTAFYKEKIELPQPGDPPGYQGMMVREDRLNDLIEKMARLNHLNLH
ncbi:MAG: hypothetical protein WC824_14625 [Bacteroidota bacterium]|jgi:hypothetical protein